MYEKDDEEYSIGVIIKAILDIKENLPIYF
jgi:hypothetical protein